MASKDIQIKAVMAAVDKLSPVLDKQSSKVKSLGRRLNALDRAMSGAASAGVNVFRSAMAPVAPLIAAAGVSITGGVASFAAYADALDATAKKTGLAVKRIQELDYAAKTNGSSAETMRAAMQKLNKTLFEARTGKNDSAKTLLERMGISLEETKDVEAILPRILDAFKRNQDPQLREKMAEALFGKGGIELVPMLSLGNSGFNDALDGFRKKHLEVTEAAVKAGADLNNSFAEARMGATALAGDVTAILGPAMNEAIQNTLKWVGSNREFIAQDVAAVVRSVSAAMESIPWTAVLGGIGVLAAGKTALAIVNLCSKVKALGTALMAIPGASAVAGAGLFAIPALAGRNFLPEKPLTQADFSEIAAQDGAGLAIDQFAQAAQAMPPATQEVRGVVRIEIADPRTGSTTAAGEVPVSSGTGVTTNPGVIRVDIDTSNGGM